MCLSILFAYLAPSNNLRDEDSFHCQTNEPMRIPFYQKDFTLVLNSDKCVYI